MPYRLHQRLVPWWMLRWLRFEALTGFRQTFALPRELSRTPGDPSGIQPAGVGDLGVAALTRVRTRLANR